MRELVRCNDPVLLSAVEALLAGAGIEALVLDGAMSALEGAIGAFPRRLLVADDDEVRARRLMIDAGLGAELREAG
ncbi:MAG: DUF2007 domain-containing protein, partial [Phyllobacteriaceae bacterium]|nr:DUF2007 domain-containing protein [Phyllobacteriaceae bacterium]